MKNIKKIILKVLYMLIFIYLFSICEEKGALALDIVDVDPIIDVVRVNTLIRTHCHPNDVLRIRNILPKSNLH
mgnify:CR=1 FL=1